MKYELKRYILMGLSFSVFGIILMFFMIGTREAILILIYSTLIFLPISYVIVKYKLYETGKFSKKYSTIIACITFLVATFTFNKIPDVLKLYIIVISFEIICLCYYLILKNENLNKNNSNITDHRKTEGSKTEGSDLQISKKRIREHII